jgi:hypothetical protein
MASPYVPLAAFLASQPSTTTVTLTLAEVEHRIGRALPAGAWARGWWQGRGEQGRLRSWLAVGWRVSGVAMRVVPPTVTFARVAAAATTEPFAPPQ